MKLREQGLNTLAMPILKKSLETSRQVLGEDHPYTAENYNEVANTLYGLGKFAEAVLLMQKALEINRRTLGEDHRDTATNYGNLGIIFHMQGKFTQATPMMQKALEIRRQALGEEHTDTVNSINSIAMNLSAQGKYGEAEILLQKALDIRRRVLGDDHLDTATIYNNLANNYFEQGKSADALPLIRKSLEIYRREKGDDHPDTAMMYNNVAGTLNAQGMHAEAEPILKKSLAIVRRLLGEEHPTVLLYYYNLSVNLASQGKYAEAATVAHKTLQSTRKVLGDDHPQTAENYQGLGVIFTRQGKYVEATPYLQNSLDAHLRLMGEEHPATASSYDFVGNNSHAQGQYEQAAPVLQKALDIRRRLLGEEHKSTVSSYHNVAANLRMQGKIAESTLLERKVLEIRRRMLGDEHPDTASSYNALALMLTDRSEATAMFQKALEIQKQHLGSYHPDTVLTQTNLAANLYKQKKYSAVLSELQLGTEAYEVARLRVSDRGLARAVFGAERSPYALYAAISAREGNAVQAWKAAEANLGRGILDDTAHHQDPTLTEEESHERQQLDAALARIEQRIQANLSLPEVGEEQRAERASLVEERTRAEDELARLAATLSQRKVAALADVQAALPADGAFVTWLDLSMVDFAGESAGEGEHWGCVVRSTGPPIWVQLPGSGPEGEWTTADDELPERLRESLAQRKIEYKALARQLRAQRIEPLLPHLKGARRLYVAAGRTMAGVPVGVLVDNLSVIYTPSGTHLARLKQRKRPAGPATLLALGDAVFNEPSDTPVVVRPLPPGGLLITHVVPKSNGATAGLKDGDVLLKYAGTKLSSFDQLLELIAAHAKDEAATVEVWRESEDEPAERQVRPGKLGVALNKRPAREVLAERHETDLLLAQATRGGDWQELPGTRVEVDRLRRLFGEQGTTLLTDSEASEQRLDELQLSGQVSKYRYLHFATHGEADSEKAFQSALVLSQDNLPTADEVVLGAKFYDGRLTAAEVLEHWKLNAELVTLSACDSALGREGGGEGLLGFSQAFLLAGSRSVCLSLWKVDDTATALLMARFYYNLLGKRKGLSKPMPKAEALAEAKEWLRNLSVDEAAKLSAALTDGVARGKGRKRLKLLPPVPKSEEQAKPYAHPYYWAAFVLVGDPE